MAAFEILLRRFNDRPHVVDEGAEWKAFRTRAAPARERAWRAWAFGQRALGRKDPQWCLNWLKEAQEALAEDRLLRAEVRSAEAASWLWLDEPRWALGPAESAWRTWLDVAGEPAVEAIAPSARILLAVLSAPNPSPALSDDEVWLAWLQDRLVRQFEDAASRLLSLYGDVDDIEKARAVSREFLDWVERFVGARFGAASGAVVAKHLLSLADVYDRCRQSADALATCQEGLAKLTGAPELGEIVSIRARLQFNAANQLARLGRYREALALFEQARDGLATIGEPESLLRVRYAIVFTKYRLGVRDDVTDELVDLAEAYEKVLASAHSGPTQMAAWQMVNKVYRMWVKVSAEALDTSDARQTSFFFHQLLALKENEAKLIAIWRRFRDRPEALVHSEISVMLDRLDQRPDTSLLIVEQVPEALVVVSFSAGPGVWHSRVTVQLIDESRTTAASALIQAQRDAVHDLVDGVIGRDDPPDDAFLRTCAGAWEMLDEGVRRSIESATTVLAILDNQTELDQLPVELFHDGDTFLGLRHDVVRVPSLTELNLLLCENRSNARSTRSALIVRAEDQLPVADVEVRIVRSRLEELGLDVVTVRGPEPADLVSRLGAGLDLFHYVGHGLADEIGEALPLGPGRSIGARDVDASRPAPAPVTMLSGCLTGRGRQLRTGHLQGFVPALLRNGCPGVIAAKYLVGEEFVPEFADLVYDSWKDGTLGGAVRAARRVLAQDGAHPAVWCSYVVFGSPDVRADAPHGREANTWPSAAIRFVATGSTQQLAAARRLLAADERLSAASRSAVARDLEALAEQDPGYFHDGIRQEDRGLDAFAEAMMASDIVRTFGVLRHGSTGRDDEGGRFGHLLMLQRILGDSYLLVAIAVELRKRTLLYLEGEGQMVMRQARRRLRWLSADHHDLAEATSILRTQED